VAKSTYDRKRQSAACEITEFRRMEDGAWVRSDYRLTQKHHPHDRVVRALECAGFAPVASFDAIADLGMTGPTGRHRTFYLARK
jgi:hypothetical protein